MGDFGKGMVPLSSQTTEDKRAYLDQRVARLGWSRSEAVTTILDFWLAMGAPALSELDAHAPVVPVPANLQEPLRAYWAHLVAFEAEDDSKKVSVKDVAQHVKNRRRGQEAPANPSRGSHTRR